MIALALLRRWWPAFLAAFLLAAAVTASVRWLHRHDARIRLEQQLIARDTLILARRDTAAVRSEERRVDSVLVTRLLRTVLRDTLWRHDTVTVDGTARIAIPAGVLLQHDSAFAACDRLTRSCAREHAADSLVIVALQRSLALARTGTAIPPPARGCTVPVLVGLGAGLAGGYVGARFTRR